MQPTGQPFQKAPSKYHYPQRGPKSSSESALVAKDNVEQTTEGMDCRPAAQGNRQRQREDGFQLRARAENLPHYKCFFDDNLAIMWASPSKTQQLQKMGFLDKSGGIVDIHEKRRAYHLAEKDIKRMEQLQAERERDKKYEQHRAITLAEREMVNTMRLERIAAERDRQRLKRAGGAMAQSTRSLP